MQWFYASCLSAVFFFLYTKAFLFQMRDEWKLKEWMLVVVLWFNVNILNMFKYAQFVMKWVVFFVSECVLSLSLICARRICYGRNVTLLKKNGAFNVQMLGNLKSSWKEISLSYHKVSYAKGFSSVCESILSCLLKGCSLKCKVCFLIYFLRRIFKQLGLLATYLSINHDSNFPLRIFDI